MDKWIIRRYNKGQSLWKLKAFINGYIAFDDPVCSTILYDFLFNPKWGFGKAFWGDEILFEGCADEFTPYIDNIQRMVISPNPLKYLEQFKPPTTTKGE